MGKLIFSFICFVFVVFITCFGFGLFGWALYTILWEGELLMGIELGVISFFYNYLVKPVSIISTTLFKGPEYKWF